MLKKISGYTTKFLLYVRNNFLSFLFKTSVFLTLLTLLYLVCVLKQSNSAQKNPQIEVRQVARSQKLTLRIPKEAEEAASTTEIPAKIYNFIPKAAHPYFPIQEQTTSSIMVLDTTSPLASHEQTAYSGGFVDSIPLQEYTTPPMMAILESSSLPNLREASTVENCLDEDQDDLFNERTTPSMVSPDKYPSLQTLEEKTLPIQPRGSHTFFPNQDLPGVTQMPISEETTSVNYPTDSHPFFPIQELTAPPAEDSDIYSPAHDLFNEDTTEPMETTQTLPSQEQTTPSTSSEDTTEDCNEQGTPTTPTSDPVAPFKRSLTPSELRFFDAIPETTTCPLEEENTDVTPMEVTPMDSTTNSYQDSDEFGVPVTTPCNTELPEISDIFGVDGEETDSLLPTDNSPETCAETEPEPETDSLFQDDEEELSAIEAPTIESETDCESAELSNVDTVTSDSHEDRLPSPDSNPFDFQNNLFNLFSFDHIPAMSNIKPTRWSSPESGQQSNAIAPIADAADEVNVSPRFLRRLNRRQHLDSLWNMRIKDSVSLLGRLFGNFMT